MTIQYRRNVLSRFITRSLWAAALGPAAAFAASSGWAPEGNVELIVAQSAGSSHDRMARVIQGIWQRHRVFEVPVTVMNKPGGGTTASRIYLSRFAGSPHHLAMAAPSMLTNHILGTATIHYSDFTPISHLNAEYIAFTVKGDSAIKNAADLVSRLKKDPTSVVFGYGTGPGSVNNIAMALVAKKAGIDFNKMRRVVFKSGAASTVALLGGHVDVITTAVAVAASQQGKKGLRIVAVSAPQRLDGPLAQTPTWKELGVDVVTSNWRNIIAPPDLKPAQVKFWESAFANLVKDEEWRARSAESYWVTQYMDSDAAGKYMASEYRELKALFSELNIVSGK